MLKPLTRITKDPLYHLVDGEKVLGPNPSMAGDTSGLWGDCSGLWGDCSKLSGNCSNLRGNCTNLSGNLDNIPMEARTKKPNLTDWIAD